MGYRPADIYILAPSLRTAKNLSPVRRLENRLVREGIPCFVPTSDDVDVRGEVTQGKVVFSTFHQVKGSERRVVLVFNFDATYYDYFARDESKDKCPNTVYVALSRAIERLSVLHHYENPHFPTVDRKILETHPQIDYLETKTLSKKRIYGKDEGREREIKTPIDNLLRHLDTSTLEKALSYLSYKISRDDGGNYRLLNIPETVETQLSGSGLGGRRIGGGGSSINGAMTSGSESVADITGIAIPAAYEIASNRSSSILKWIHEESQRLAPDHYKSVGEIGKKLKQGLGLSPPELLYLANVYQSIETGWTSKLAQITKYDWLSEEDLTEATGRLQSEVLGVEAGVSVGEPGDQRLEFEVATERCLLGRSLMGRIDLISSPPGGDSGGGGAGTRLTGGSQGQTWYELKCLSSLESEHILKLAILAWTKYARVGQTRLVVFNILNGEKAVIEVTDSIGDLVYYLVNNKYKQVGELSDSEFRARLASKEVLDSRGRSNRSNPSTVQECLI